MTYQDRLNAGIAALQDGDAAAAEAELQACLDERPDDPQALLYLGIAKGTSGRLDEAEVLLEQAAALAPRDPKVRFNLARLHHRRGNRDRAIAGYRATLEIDPAYDKATDALRQLGEVVVETPPPPPVERPPLTDEELGRGHAPVEAPLAQPYHGPTGELACRRVDVVSVAKVTAGLAAGLGVIYGLIALVVAPIAMASEDESPLLGLGIAVGILILGPPIMAACAALGGLIQGALFNLCANWMGALAFELDHDRTGVALMRVEPFAFARLATAAQAVVMLVYAIIIVPLVGFAVAAAASFGGGSSGGGPGLAAALGIAFGVGLVMLIVGLGVCFVVNLLIAMTFNWVAGLAGGVVMRLEEAGRYFMVRRVEWRSSYVTLLVTAMPWLVLYGLLQGAMQLLASEPLLAVLFFLGYPVGGCLMIAFYVGVYNLATRYLGGLCFEVEED